MTLLHCDENASFFCCTYYDSFNCIVQKRNNNDHNLPAKHRQNKHSDSVGDRRVSPW